MTTAADRCLRTEFRVFVRTVSCSSILRQGKGGVNHFLVAAVVLTVDCKLCYEVVAPKN